MYAFLIDGMTPEGRDTIDKALEGSSPNTASQAKRERAAIATLMGLPKGGAAT